MSGKRASLENLCKSPHIASNMEVDVRALMRWIKEKALRIPQEYYQREPGYGWTPFQTGVFLASVLADQAKIPIVISKRRKTMRVMDGGHRLRALKDFTQGKVKMLVVEKRHVKPNQWISWNELGQEYQDIFKQRKLSLLKYDKLSLHDEIQQYVQLNSALPFKLTIAS